MGWGLSAARSSLNKQAVQQQRREQANQAFLQKEASRAYQPPKPATKQPQQPKQQPTEAEKQQQLRATLAAELQRRRQAGQPQQKQAPKQQQPPKAPAQQYKGQSVAAALAPVEWTPAQLNSFAAQLPPLKITVGKFANCQPVRR